jgi:hypothetical protein
MSKFGLGLDNMLRYLIDDISNTEMEDAFVKHTDWDLRKNLFGKKRIESDKIGIATGGFTVRTYLHV